MKTAAIVIGVGLGGLVLFMLLMPRSASAQPTPSPFNGLMRPLGALKLPSGGLGTVGRTKIPSVTYNPQRPIGATRSEAAEAFRRSPADMTFAV